MSIQVRQELFDDLSEEWERLAQQAPAAPVFMTPAWLRSWWEHCRTDEELLLLSFREGGALHGVAPLMRSNGVIRFLALPDVCDHHDFVYAAGAASSFYPALLDTLDGLEWSSVILDGLVEDSPTLVELPPLAGAMGIRLTQEQDGVSPVIDLPASFDAYLEGLNKKDRHELRRKLRRLSEAGAVRCADVAQEPDLDAQLDLFLDLMRGSKAEKALFMTPERERFFRSLARALAQAGRLKLFFLELDGARVAASLCFDYDNAYYLYNSGFDTRYAGLSAGLLLKTLCLRDAIERGRKRFHFLRGAEQYKYDLGGRDCRLVRLTLWPR